MLAAERSERLYPVWLPDRVPARPSGLRRRLRWNPVAGAMVTAVLLTLPALLFVSQRATRAETGYAILRLQHDLSGLRAENARLHSLASAMKSPQRIERYATTELGMAPPRLQQLAAVTVGPAIARLEPPVEHRGVLRLLGDWLWRGEAEARERTR